MVVVTVDVFGRLPCALFPRAHVLQGEMFPSKETPESGWSRNVFILLSFRCPKRRRQVSALFVAMKADGVGVDGKSSRSNEQLSIASQGKIDVALFKQSVVGYYCCNTLALSRT